MPTTPVPTVFVPYEVMELQDAEGGLAWCLHSHRPFARDLILRCPAGHVSTLRSFERIGALPEREAWGAEIDDDGRLERPVCCARDGCSWTARVILEEWATLRP